MSVRPAPSAPHPAWSGWRVTLVEPDAGRPLCLTLANTRHFRNGAAPRETLHGYADVVEWARRNGVVGDADARRLQRDAASAGDAGRRELASTIELREAVARIFARHAQGATPAAADFAIVVGQFNEAARHLKLELQAKRLVPAVARRDAGLPMPRWQAALSAIALLSSPALAKVKACADDRGCGWLFVDQTRNGSRRFCFSDECGNRARQQRFRLKGGGRE